MASTTRQALLQALSAAEGAYISGQQLAQQLGVSRAAVHKAAAALTAQGYALEAASRRGYRLLGGDPFCTEAVGPYPAPVQLYDTLESTNRTAKLLALDGAAHGIQQRRAAAGEILLFRQGRHLAQRQAVMDDRAVVGEKHRGNQRLARLLLLLCEHGVEAADGVRLQPGHRTAAIQNKNQFRHKKALLRLSVLTL